MTPGEKIVSDHYQMKLLCAEMPIIADRMRRLGLLKSMHAINDATFVLGFEVAEKIEQHTKER